MELFSIKIRCTFQLVSTFTEKTIDETVDLFYQKVKEMVQ